MRLAKTINCVEFLPDDSLLTGDSTGTLTIWAPIEDDHGELDFVVKEFKGHEVCLAYTSDTHFNLRKTDSHAIDRNRCAVSN